ELDDSHYLTLYKNSFEVDRKSYKTDFTKDLETLKKLALVADKGIKFGDYVNLEESRAGVEKLATLLSQNATALQKLKDIVGKLEIDIDGTYDSDPKYYTDKLSFGVKTTVGNTTGLVALFELAPVLKDIGADFDVSSYDLDNAFASGAKLVVASKVTLIAKKKNIKKITIWSSNSDYSSEYLYVGSSDSKSTFDKILAKIPN
ncbi:MAG: hypothetical protein AAB250_10830, partial [Bdellovibrionota bacterium]